MYVPMLFDNIWGYNSALYVQDVDPTNPEYHYEFL